MPESRLSMKITLEKNLTVIINRIIMKHEQYHPCLSLPQFDVLNLKKLWSAKIYQNLSLHTFGHVFSDGLTRFVTFKAINSVNNKLQLNMICLIIL